MSQANLDAMIAALADDYRASVRDDLETLARGGLCLIEDRATMREIAHRHAGSAGSLGFPALGEAAFAADKALQAPPTGQDALIVASWLGQAQHVAGLS